jgi:hypothetical protein
VSNQPDVIYADKDGKFTKEYTLPLDDYVVHRIQILLPDMKFPQTTELDGHSVAVHVYATQADHERVKKAIAQAEEEAKEERTFEAYPLSPAKNADAESERYYDTALEFVRLMLGDLPVQSSVDRGSRQLFVLGRKHDHDRAKEAVAVLQEAQKPEDWDAIPADKMILRIHMLRDGIDAQMQLDFVRSLLPLAQLIIPPRPQPPRFSPQLRGVTRDVPRGIDHFVLYGRKSDHEKVKGMLEKMQGATQTAEKVMVVFELTNISPQEMAKHLNDHGGFREVLAYRFDVATNSLLVTGTKEQIEVIQAIVEKYDVPAGGREGSDSPHPNPLPEGEGTKGSPQAEGEGTKGNPGLAESPRADDLVWKTLGIRYVPADKESGGVLVQSVRTDSPAATAGITEGDTIISFGQWKMDKPHAMRWIASNWKELQILQGGRVTVDMIREGTKYVAEIVMQE